MDSIIYTGEWYESFTSSNVHRFRYDLPLHDLFVQFHDSSVYVYHEVDEQTVDDFVSASSKGVFVWERLRDKYDYEKLA